MWAIVILIFEGSRLLLQDIRVFGKFNEYGNSKVTWENGVKAFAGSEYWLWWVKSTKLGGD
jgi:hypothetical protein